MLRLTAKVSDLLVPGNMGAWPEVRDRLNRLLGGWAAYFSYGTRLMAYRAVDNHVYDRVPTSWFGVTRCRRAAPGATPTG